MGYADSINEIFSLNDFFDEFIRELIECKKIATRTNEVNAEININEIQKKLTNFIIDTSSSFKQNSGDFENNNLNEAIYIMVSLGDEIFLNLGWPGAVMWEKRLLEDSFFKTHDAGEKIFVKIDKILSRKSFFLVDISELYLKLLALGFLGKFRGTREVANIDIYKQKLYRFISSIDQQNETGKIFSEAYNFTLTGMPKCYLPNEYSFDYIIYTFIVLFLIGTSIFWYLESSELNYAIETLISTNGN